MTNEQEELLSLIAATLIEMLMAEPNKVICRDDERTILAKQMGMALFDQLQKVKAEHQPMGFVR